MAFAKHLAVADVCCTAFAPCRNVVSIHVPQLPYFRSITIMADGVIWAVTNSNFSVKVGS